MIVKELKELLKDLDDNTPVAVFRSNMQGSGYTESGVTATIRKMTRVKERRYDAFDHTPYSAEVLYPALNSAGQDIDVLIIG